MPDISPKTGLSDKAFLWIVFYGIVGYFIPGKFGYTVVTLATTLIGGDLAMCKNIIARVVGYSMLFSILILTIIKSH